MGKRRTKNIIGDIYDECVCANECTGLYQKVSLDKEEIAKFHRQFTGEEKLDKKGTPVAFATGVLVFL